MLLFIIQDSHGNNTYIHMLIPFIFTCEDHLYSYVNIYHVIITCEHIIFSICSEAIKIKENR